MTQKDIDWCKYRIYLALIQIKTEFDTISRFFRNHPGLTVYHPGVNNMQKRGKQLLDLKMEVWNMYTELCNMEVTNE